MSPRDLFWFLAGALATLAIMLTVRAWLRERPALAGKAFIPSFAVPVAAGLALLGVALGVYFLLGSPQSIPGSTQSVSPSHALTAQEPAGRMGQSSAAAGSLDDVTNKLAARLAAKGGSDNDWKLLAESYEYMGRSAEAKAARAHNVSMDATAAMASGADRDSGDQPVSQVSGDQMAAIADALDSPAGNQTGVDAAAMSSSSPATSVTATQSTVEPTAASNAEISGTVEIASRFAPRAGSGATLFIYAKQPDAAGPPVAVLRVRAEHWPVNFTLNDANAMVPGRNLSHAGSVRIEARISRNGDALPQSGDLVGSVTSVNPRAGHPVKISIDREIG